MASDIRWALVYWTLTQVVLYCAALGDPVHVKLELDDELSKLKGLVKMRYSSQEAAEPKYFNSGQKEQVESSRLIKLYIRGKFKIEKNTFVWNNQKKAKELVALILKLFRSDAVVIVVFPDDLQTSVGFEFQKEFEEEVRKQNGKITVGRGVINVYLGLGDQNQVKDDLNKEIERQNMNVKAGEKDEKYYSIFATYSSNAFSFETVFSRGPHQPEDLFRVQIQEADSVAVKLKAVCTSDNNSLKVGSQAVQDLAKILLQLLRVQGVEPHPKQRVRIELPENCWDEKKRIDFTESLVELLKKDLNAFGKEPLVHMHVYDGLDQTFIYDKKSIENAHPQDIFVEIKNGKIQTQVDNNDRVKASSAKELFIHIHCHGKLELFLFTVCGAVSETLAKVLSEFVKKLLEHRVKRVGIVKFHVCNAGKLYAQTYVIDFLTKFDDLLRGYEINIQECLSFMPKTSQINEHLQVTVPFETRGDAVCILPEKQVYSRFTVRTTKTDHGYEAFTVLPFTEYNILYPK